jgi:hypothetical protein
VESSRCGRWVINNNLSYAWEQSGEPVGAGEGSCAPASGVRVVPLLKICLPLTPRREAAGGGDRLEKGHLHV